MRALLYILLLMISPEIFAGIFDPPPTDRSVSILGLIFGSNIGNIYLGGVANPILSSLMEKFNFIIVAVGALVVSYVSILSVVNTAQEGEAMGKRWSSMWIPLRTIAGMTLMIPSPGSGYSLIQVTVTWIILQGIGAADQIWNLALDGLLKGSSATVGGALAPDISGKLSSSASSLTENLLAASVCMEALNEISKTGDHAKTRDWLNTHAMYINQYSTDPVVKSMSRNQVAISGTTRFGVNDPSVTIPSYQYICGSVDVTGTANASDFGSAITTDMSDNEVEQILVTSAQKIYEGKQLVISSMLSILQPLAEAIVRGTVDPLVLVPGSQTLKRPASINTQLNPQGYKTASNDAYVKILSGLIVPIDSNNIKQDVKDAIKTGEQQGWIVAGAYYFIFNRSVTPQYFSDIYTPMVDSNMITCSCGSPGATTCTAGSCAGKIYANPAVYDLASNAALQRLSLSPDEIQAISTYLATANIYLSKDTDPSSGLNFSSSLAGNKNPLINAIAAPLNKLVNNLIVMMNGAAGSSTGDVLLAHSNFGRDMMLAMEATWIGIIAIAAALSVVAYFGSSSYALYLGLLTTLIAMILPIVALVWSIGASLAIYAPLIPFFIFTTATAGWLIAVIEAIIAAPLIALGLVLPSGDELGKLETALMILANIFFRPMLMIIGFLIAGRLYNAIVHLIDIGMLEVLNTINVQTIFSSILVLFIYASFVLSVTNTSFSLIYGLPDKLLRWMGGHLSERTDTAPIEAAKGAISSAAKETSSSISEGGSVIAQKANTKFAEQAEKNTTEKLQNKYDAEKKATGFASNSKANGTDAMQTANEMNLNGFSSGDIANGLKGAGYSKKDIKEAMDELKSKGVP